MIRRITGTLLILIGMLGIALSALGVLYVWRAVEDVQEVAHDSLALASDTLEDIDRSLDVASSTLDGTVTAMDGLYTTTLQVSETLSGTQITVDEIADLTEEDLPQSIESSLIALDAVVETAAIIDQLLASLQLLGIANYEPAIPLDEAIAEAGVGLEPVPDSLRVIGAGLQQTNASLEDVQDGIDLMGDQLVGIRQNIVEAEDVLDGHRSTTKDLQSRLKRVDQTIDRPIQLLAWGATLLLVWIALSQLATLRWGASLWQRQGRRSHPSPDSQP
jgi:uncharacterized protein YoxC